MGGTKGYTRSFDCSSYVDDASLAAEISPSGGGYIRGFTCSGSFAFMWTQASKA